ncbi:MAG: VCBS repeat-containing protein, partial [Deltaproteobacteria bacterium]|nr:VCBS repeat-containing protein [Deltaproteobacteria bacterium]
WLPLTQSLYPCLYVANNGQADRLYCPEYQSPATTPERYVDYAHAFEINSAGTTTAVQSVDLNGDDQADLITVMDGSIRIFINTSNALNMCEPLNTSQR